MRGGERGLLCAMVLGVALSGCVTEPTGGEAVERPRSPEQAAPERPPREDGRTDKPRDGDRKPRSSQPPAVGTPERAASGVPGRAIGPYAVVDVVDGDTVEVARRGGTTLRLIGIDTPEVVHPTEPVECFGPQASRRAHRFLDGRRVYLEFDASQGRHDAYGRTLAYVWLPNARVSMNERMVRGGYALEYTYDTPYRYQGRFVAAEGRARRNHRGLWKPSTCDGDVDQPASGDTGGGEPAGSGGTDPRYRTCGEANEHGYGPYRRGRDPEYGWYTDADGDGLVCET